MLCKRLNFVGTFAMMLMVRIINADALGDQLQQMRRSDLGRLYGQDNLEHNENRSCYRDCDGEIKVCYYRFKMENFNVMGSACGDCAKGKIDDCFKKNCLTVNGMERNVMSIGRQIPGPDINVCKGDRVVVDVENHLAGANIAIHWHGILQVATPWSDGVPMVTQCPIADSNSFRYHFIATEAGTHFWHCHSGMHRLNGCIGKLVVRNSKVNDPHSARYDYDIPDHQVMLSDWTNQLGEDYMPAKVSVSLKVDSFLINGRGTYRNPDDNTRSFAPISVFRVQRGKRTRFRMQNGTSQRCFVELCIQNHRLTMIATDGSPFEPIVVDCFYSTSGERYDFVLNPTIDRNVTEVYMRVRGFGICANSEVQELARIMIVDDLDEVEESNYDYLPVLDYPPYDQPYTNDITLNNPNTVCGSSASYCIPDLIPIPGSNYESLRNIHEIEYVEPILMQFDVHTAMSYPAVFLQQGITTVTATINNISSTKSPVPGLAQDDFYVPYCNAANLPSECNSTTNCNCPHMIELKLNRTYDLIFRDGDGNTYPNVSHPFHVHGYLLQVLEIGFGDTYETGNPVYQNLTRDAPLKDTIMIPRGGYGKLRFRATNPGYWFVHCHVEIHMRLGMALILKVGDKSDMVPVPKNFPTCGDYPRKE